MEAPNGIGLSPDEKVLYVAETPTGRVWACRLSGPGEVAGRSVLATAPGAAPFNLGLCDSLCVDGEGNVIVATIVNGGLTSISPDGTTVKHTPTGDILTTNACFGGPGLRTLYATLSGRGQLVAFDNWPTKGLALNFATSS
jgi:gluconolactonase